MTLLHSIQFSAKALITALEELGIAQAGLSDQALKVSDISLDSRQSTAHIAFIALKGAKADGHDYIENAIERDCKLILCESSVSKTIQQSANQHGCVIFVVKELKARLAVFLSHLYLSDAEKLQGKASDSSVSLTAVTGTNGKTSVASLHAQLALVQQKQSASLGTVGLSVFTKEADQVSLMNFDVGVNTTPDIVSHYKILALLQAQGIYDYCLEASSHGIEQQRLSGLPISCAIFTNLTQDHLDYHGTLEAYAEAKRGLLEFPSIKYLVLNADDPESKNWQLHNVAGAQLVWYGLTKDKLPTSATNYCFANALKFTPKGVEFSLVSSWGNASLSAPLFGAFNVSNILAALCSRLIRGDDFNELIALIPRVKGVLGRMELFINKGDRANLIVDYAHTPDALKQALIAARRHTRGKLYCVFGCGGDRDKTKRPIMGEQASQLSDVVVLTQDNTRNESAEQIIAEIKHGMSGDAQVHVELDRKAAIRWAWQNSKQDDLILLAGKGHEDYLEIANKRIAYSEREFVQQLISEAAA